MHRSESVAIGLRTAAGGALCWWLHGLWRPAVDAQSEIERLLLFHLFCLTPLLLGRAGTPAVERALPAALFVVAAGNGRPVAAMALVWLVFALGALVDGLRRLRFAPLDLPAAADAAGRVFLVVAGGWILLDRLGVVLPGLSPEHTRLAAIHSLYTGFTGLSLLGLAGTELRARRPGSERWLLVPVLGLIVGFAATGLGIAFYGPLELIGAGLLFLALTPLAFVELLVGGRARGWARTGWFLSGLSLLGGLAMGLGHALRWVGLGGFAREAMLRDHGWPIALGFGLGGTLASLLAVRPRRREGAAAPLLLYDGACGLCARSVQWILAHDQRGELRFAPLQGETAAPILARHGLDFGGNFDSVVLVHDPDGPRERLLLRYPAALGILAVMGGTRAALGRLARIVPPGLGDLGYRLVARFRQRLFPPPDACQVPTPAVRARMLP